MITLEELYLELDRLRTKHIEINFTDEQKAFLKYGRENIKPVPWIALTKLFNETFNENFKVNNLTQYYLRYVK